jgi:hypothetical protein
LLLIATDEGEDDLVREHAVAALARAVREGRAKFAGLGSSADRAQETIRLARILLNEEGRLHSWSDCVAIVYVQWHAGGTRDSDFAQRAWATVREKVWLAQYEASVTQVKAPDLLSQCARVAE